MYPRYDGIPLHSLLKKSGHIGAQGAEEDISTSIFLRGPYCDYNIRCCDVKLCK
jgi:hypothetical protein